MNETDSLVDRQKGIHLHKSKFDKRTMNERLTVPANKVVANAQLMKMTQGDFKKKAKQSSKAANLTWLTESSQASGKAPTHQVK